MKKVLSLLVVAVLGYGGFVAYKHFFRNERRVCEKLVTLCAKGEVAEGRLESCEKGLLKLRELSGPEKAKKAGQCILESSSCIGAVGCMAGASMGAAEEFFQGMRKAMENK